jgi:N-succinyl-L-ornithine transcarbamylase
MRLPWKSSKQNIDQGRFILGTTPHSTQAVANSFVEMMQLQEADFVITHPEGYELNQITKDSRLSTIRIKHLKMHFIYTKNWSSYKDYGKITNNDPNGLTADKMKLTNNAKFMHCLPVRRNVIVPDE